MDKIIELRQSIAEKTKELRTLLDGVTVAKRGMNEEETKAADALERSIQGLQDQIKREERLRDIEQSLPKPEQRGQMSEAPQIIMGRKEDLESGIRFARYIKVSVMEQRRGETFEEVAKRMYPKDTILQGARAAAMNTLTPSEGGAIVPEEFMAEIIPILREQSKVRALGARTIPLPTGKMKIPRQTGAANFKWVGENKPIIASNIQLGTMNLNAKKLAGIIPTSNELLKSSAISADMIIRDEIVTGIAESEDVTAIYGKGTDDEPAGIIEMATNTIEIGALPSSDDLGNIVGVIMSQKFPSRENFGWMFNGVLWSRFYNLKDGVGNYLYRAEMDQKRLNGFKFEINNNMTIGKDAHASTSLIFGDFSHFIIGDTMGLEIAISKEASYSDGQKMVSAFESDQTLMRGIVQEDFGVRYANAFVIANKVWSK